MGSSELGVWRVAVLPAFWYFLANGRRLSESFPAHLIFRKPIEVIKESIPLSSTPVGRIGAYFKRSIDIVKAEAIIRVGHALRSLESARNLKQVDPILTILLAWLLGLLTPLIAGSSPPILYPR